MRYLITLALICILKVYSFGGEVIKQYEIEPPGMFKRSFFYCEGTAYKFKTIDGKALLICSPFIIEYEKD